jgi:hypothetical protein
MKVDAIQVETWGGVGSRSDGQYHYTLKAHFLACTTVDGDLKVIDGLDLQVLERKGFLSNARDDKHYDETPGGGSPAMAEVGTYQLQWVNAELQQRQAEWIGRDTIADVTDKPEA